MKSGEGTGVWLCTGASNASSVAGSTSDAATTRLLWSFLAVAVIALLGHRLWSFSSLKLPPGPRGWPIVGNMLQLSKNFVAATAELGKQYGPVVKVWVGSTPLIVITAGKEAHAALIDHGAVFASRPMWRTQRLLTNNFRTVNSALYGPLWRSLRKTMVTEVLSPGRVSTYKQWRELAVERLLSDFRSQAAKDDQAGVPVLSTCRKVIMLLLLRICFGDAASESLREKFDALMRPRLQQARIRIEDHIPLLRLIPGRRWLFEAKLKKFMEERARLLQPLVEERRQTMKSGKITDANSYVDSLLALQSAAGKEFELANTDIVPLCTELVIGGTDTTANVVEWAMANLISNPEMQTKLYEEIATVAGSRAVRETDIESMPYLQAVVKEALRRHPPGHFTLPHAVTQPTKLAGYDIPTHAAILVHISSISRDPQVWENPLQFKPERFLDMEVDITGSREIKMIPFGAGRRICPGINLGLLHSQLLLASLVQTFEWSPSKPGEVIDLTEKVEFTTVMKTPLTARIRERQ